MNTITTHNFSTSVKLLLICGAIHTPTILAQTTSNNAAHSNGLSAKTLEEVVVTARRREESAQDVPIALSNFSGETMAAIGASNTEGVAFHTPNLTFTTSAGSDSTLKPAIRGQAQNDNVATLDQSVGIYVDDVIWARPLGVRANLADIERVEVLRGPQGTLFGRNTTGGAIQIHTKNPVFRTEAELGVRLGNFDRKDYHMIFNTPLIDDVLALRIAYDAQKNDGWSENVSGNFPSPAIDPVEPGADNSNTGQDDSQNLIMKLAYNPTEDLNFLLKLDRSEGNFRQRSQILTGLVDNTTDPLATVQPNYPLTTSDFISDDYDKVFEGDKIANSWRNQGVSLSTNWDASDDISVSFIGAYRDLKAYSNQDIDGTPVQILGTEISLTGHNMHSLELQINGSSFNDALDWTAGIYTFEENGQDESRVRVGQLINFGFLQNTKGNIMNSSDAIFAQGTFHASSDLAITLGLRYSEETKELVSMNAGRSYTTGAFIACMIPDIYTGVTGTPSEDSCKASFSRDDDSLDYTFMLSYNISPDQMMYFKVASGFRSGGQNLRGGSIFARNSEGSVNTFKSFAPEEVTEYEVGLKADFFDSRLRTNLAYFYSDYTDIQRSTLVGTSTVVSNAAEGTIQGIEAEITALLTDSWTAGVTAGWLDTKYNKFEDDSGDRSNEPFVASPEYSFSLWSSYVIDLEIGELTLRGDYSWQDDYSGFSTTIIEGTDTPSAGLLNARAQWNVNEHIELSLWGRNLSDERYRVYGLEALGMTIGIGNEPRTYGVEAKYHFGP